jgi:hypothetical protein
VSREAPNHCAVILLHHHRPFKERIILQMVRSLTRQTSALMMSLIQAACFVVFSTGHLLACDDVKHTPGLNDPIAPAADCSSCTRRHEALAKAKKLREKKRLAPAMPEKKTSDQ